MPCLNEAETLAVCIARAKSGLERTGVSGEIIIADNGSSDGSVKIAERAGARVVHVSEKGYGNALRAGISAARGRWIIMGDADDSYDFSEIGGFIDQLRNGKMLVMGCRLPIGGGVILPGAMPWKNRWLGNPVLSFLGRLFFKTPLHDFHCGLRAFTKAAYETLNMTTTGMEFASEMVMKAALKGLPVAEVPITLHPDGRSRPPHLRAWRDGWRHLRFMLIYSPRWLFLVPGLFLTAIGTASTLLLSVSSIRAFGIVFDVGTQLISAAAIICGAQMVSLACFTKVFGIAEGLLPEDHKFAQVFRYLTLERGIVAGLLLVVTGLGLLGRALWLWKAVRFGQLAYADNIRLLIAAATALCVGMQIVGSSFFMSILGLNTTQRTPPTPESPTT
ncbi:MAG: glycosyltransferase family 2 protein [Chthoniobacter sp.]|nr:glycosyltransferase family 2 protein [Chthoniobacter sp.]